MMSKEDWREYRKRPEVKEKRKIESKKYIEKNREKIKEYRKRPEVKERRKKYQKEYSQTPKAKKSKALRDKKYYIKNKNKIKEYKKKWEENNYENQKIKKKQYQIKNKERLNIAKKKYSQRPEVKERRKKYIKTDEYKIKKQLSDKKYRSENKEKIKIIKYNYLKHKRKTDIKYQIRDRTGHRTRMAVNNYIKKGLLPNKVDKLINWKEVCEHLESTKPDNWQEYHIDHIKPLCSFDLTNEEELKAANHYTNLQWLTPEENLSKGGKY